MSTLCHGLKRASAWTALIYAAGCGALVSFDYKAETMSDAGEGKLDGAASKDASPGTQTQQAEAGAPTPTPTPTPTPKDNHAGDGASQDMSRKTQPVEQPQKTVDAGKTDPPTTPGPATTQDTDGDAGVEPGDPPVPLGVRCQGTPAIEIALDTANDLAKWMVTSTDAPMPAEPAEYARDDGSPSAGAALVRVGFALPSQSVKVGTATLLARTTECMSVRLKVLASPGNPFFENEKAGWYMWAKDRTGCLAQTEIGMNPWWHYEITTAGVWYELGAKTNELTPNGCTSFDPGQVTQLGVGFSSGSKKTWQAAFLTDTFRVY